MKIIDKVVIADIGKTLRVFDNDYESYVIGDNGATLNDIKEGKYIPVESEVMFIPYNSYGELVTNLIRTKYSLDQELAINANSRIDPNSKEEKDFQIWRRYCKKLAKKYE